MDLALQVRAFSASVPLLIERKSKRHASALCSYRNLVDIQVIAPTIKIDLKYATSHNFTGQIIYRFQQCMLIEEAALRLSNAQRALESMQLGLKIWDGFRPLEAQWRFWELLPDERYISDPRKGGRHTRGTSVDVTLVTQGGDELPMPSLFDDFSEKAHRTYMGCSREAKMNCNLLQYIMEEHGFIGLPTEWWHFDLKGWETYAPIDWISH